MLMLLVELMVLANVIVVSIILAMNVQPVEIELHITLTQKVVTAYTILLVLQAPVPVIVDITSQVQTVGHVVICLFFTYVPTDLVFVNQMLILLV